MTLYNILSGNISAISEDVRLDFLFGTPVVTINDLKVCQKSLKNECFRESFITTFTNHEIPAFELNGHLWQHRRKINHESLKSVINSKYIDTEILNLIKTSLFTFIDEQIDENDNVYQCRNDIHWITFAFIFLVIYGKNQSVPRRDSVEANKFIQSVRDVFVAAPWLLLIPSIPVAKIRKYLYERIGVAAILKSQRSQIKYWYTLNFNNKQSAYLEIMLKSFAKQKVFSDIESLFNTGFHTTSGSIETALYSLCLYPDAQQKVYQELKRYNDDNDNNGVFKLKDINKLHSLRAFIHETMRFHPVMSFTLPRTVKSQMKIGNYNIPKNSKLIADTKHIQRNKMYWKYPNNFCIDKFLGDDGKFKANGAFCEFGFGRRNCVTYFTFSCF